MNISIKLQQSWRFYIWRAFAALIVIWLISHLFAYIRQTFPDRTHAMTSLTSSMRPACFGRYLLNVPNDSQVDVSMFSILGQSVTIESNVSRNEFNLRMQSRWAELEQLKASYNNVAYVSPSRKIEPFPDAYVFLFEEMEIDVSMESAKIQMERLHETEGYLWRNNYLYVFSRGNNRENRMIEVMQRLEPWDGITPPAKPGLCLAGAFLAGENKTEGVQAEIKIPSKNLSFIVSHGFNDEMYDEGETLLERNSQAQEMLRAMLANGMDTHVFRRAKHPVGEFLRGEEYIYGVTEQEPKSDGAYETHISADWLAIGKHTKNSQTLSASMGATFKTPSSPKGKYPDDLPATLASESEFFSVWDAMIESIRPRPGAF